MAQPMFDRKIETAAQRYIRATLIVEEAKENLEICKAEMMKLVPEGSKYVTKDGETISHFRATKRFNFDPVRIKALVTPRIWKKIRVDAIDVAVLKGLLAAGEVSHESIADGVDTIEVRSSLRVTWPALKRSIA